MNSELAGVSEIVSFLSEIGWACNKDEVGDQYCLMEMGGRQIQLIPLLQRRPDHYRFSLAPSISCSAFSKAAAEISGDLSDFEPIVQGDRSIMKLRRLSRSELREMVAGVLSWASVADVDGGLAGYRNLPTNAKGGMPIRHLAALAIAGDVPRLQEYERCFGQGNRLGFVPYVSLDMIRRAVAIAAKRGEGE